MFFVLYIIVNMIYFCALLPMKDNDELTKEKTSEKVGDEYERYVNEAINMMKEDPHLAKILNISKVDLFVSKDVHHKNNLTSLNVRNKLDEQRRLQVENLRKVTLKDYEIKHGLHRQPVVDFPPDVDGNRQNLKDEKKADVDFQNDRNKLLDTYKEELMNLDAQQKLEFKRHEMKKEYEYKHSLDALNEEERNAAVIQHDVILRKHKDQPKIHEPGHKEQLQEVWEEEDHMRGEEFNPSSFFHLHDLNGDKVLDEFEAMALFRDAAKHPDEDSEEQHEEMERMNSHFFEEADVDKDRMVSLDEFLNHASDNDFQTDDEWKNVFSEDLFSEDEFQQYENEREEEEENVHRPEPNLQKDQPGTGQGNHHTAGDINKQEGQGH